MLFCFNHYRFGIYSVDDFWRVRMVTMSWCNIWPCLFAHYNGSFVLNNDGLVCFWNTRCMLYTLFTVYTRFLNWVFGCFSVDLSIMLIVM